MSKYYEELANELRKVNNTNPELIETCATAIEQLSGGADHLQSEIRRLRELNKYKSYDPYNVAVIASISDPGTEPASNQVEVGPTPTGGTRNEIVMIKWLKIL